MKKGRSLTNRHHVIPRSRGGKSDDSNVVTIDRRAHAVLHEAFGNRIPSEYLKCVSDEVRGYSIAFTIVRSIARHYGKKMVLDAIDSL